MIDQEIKLISIKNDSVEEIIETHISWVLVGNNYVYKLKKPVQFSFLDFSTINKRKYYCKQELVLNNRLTTGMYLDVVAVTKRNNSFYIGIDDGEVYDFAVKMTKQDRSKQMHLLLEENKVTGNHMIQLAQSIARFHLSTDIIHSDFNEVKLRNTFNDINSVTKFIKTNYGNRYSKIITDSVDYSNHFIKKYNSEFKERVKRQMIRDCHGDLHSRNIFIDEKPIIFDCIEFNPAFRQIDLLYEIAFFLMDLDGFSRKDLGTIFLAEYLRYFPSVCESVFDNQLLLYYKLLRANIKVKVMILKTMQHSNLENLNDTDEIKRYLRLMMTYHHTLKK